MSSFGFAWRLAHGPLLVAVLLCTLAASPLTLAAAAASAGQSLQYELDYEAHFLPAEGVVQVRATVRQPRQLLRLVRFDFDPARYRDFRGDGELEVADKEVRWRPPLAGGTLEFSLLLNHKRRGGAFDSLMEKDWAVFRGDDLFPPATVTALRGAESRARLRLTGPDGWSFVSAYPRAHSSSDWRQIEWADRRFDRPVGWMSGGRLGVRWEKISGRQVAVAGPVGQGIRRLDMLAFLHWNLPALVEVFPEFPARLLLVSAGDPMWRGGLSGPHSLYIHADRPLISANGTSTLLHELMHVAQAYRATRDEDWIVEGLAEYYTLEIMQRSGTISAARRDRGFRKLEEWAERADGLEAKRSTGARTAKGATVMRALDAELRRRTKDRHSLDDVARALAEEGEPVSLERLRGIAAKLAGVPLRALSDESLARY